MLMLSWSASATFSQNISRLSITQEKCVYKCVCMCVIEDIDKTVRIRVEQVHRFFLSLFVCCTFILAIPEVSNTLSSISRHLLCIIVPKHRHTESTTKVLKSHARTCVVIWDLKQASEGSSMMWGGRTFLSWGGPATERACSSHLMLVYPGPGLIKRSLSAHLSALQLSKVCKKCFFWSAGAFFNITCINLHSGSIELSSFFYLFIFFVCWMKCSG